MTKGIITWVYPSEIFPTAIRAQGNSLATFTNWALGLIIGQVSPIALSAIGFKYFYVFFVFNILAFFSYLLLFPETKGKTLEQMDELFGDQLVAHPLDDEKAAAEVLEGKSGVSISETVV